MSKVIMSSSDKTKIVFHYNRQHNKNRAIPPWVIRHKGKAYYVHHLESEVGFNTRETPTSPTTRGSLHFTGVLSVLDDDGIITAIVKD